MNLLDIIIIIVIVFLVIRGLIRGVFMEIASLAGVVFGFLLGLHFHPTVATELKPYIPNLDSFSLQLISFVITFVLVLSLCNFTGWIIKVILKKSSLGWMDRGLGAGLAILKGIIIIHLAIVVMVFFVSSKTPLVARSKLAPLIISSYQSLVSVISPDFYQRWKQRLTEQTERIGNVVSKKIEDIADTNGSR